MTYLDRDLGPDGPTHAPAKPVTTQRTPAAAPPPLLDLQRLAGNAAVTQAVKSGRFEPDLSIQRIDDPESMEAVTQISRMRGPPSTGWQRYRPTPDSCRTSWRCCTCGRCWHEPTATRRGIGSFGIVTAPRRHRWALKGIWPWRRPRYDGVRD